MERKVFHNKNNNQFSIVLPKKAFKDKIPISIDIKIKKIKYLPNPVKKPFKIFGVDD